MCDGSVRFLKNSTANPIVWALGSPPAEKFSPPTIIDAPSLPCGYDSLELDRGLAKLPVQFRIRCDVGRGPEVLNN